jgi:hypothetical protein
LPERHLRGNIHDAEILFPPNKTEGYVNTDAEGMFVATTCLVHALFSALADRAVLSPSEIGHVVGNAEEYLAGLRPEMMSADGREYARKVLQEFGQIFPPGRPRADS